MLVPGPCPLLAAEPIYIFEPEDEPADLNRGLEPDELFYHPREEFFYGENWHHMAKLDQGYVIYSNVFITNMGLSRPSCAVEFSILAPDGKIFTSKRDYQKERINASTSSYSIQVAENSLGGEHPSYRLHLEQDGMVVDLVFQNLLPGWKYNSGIIYFGKDRQQFWKYVITSPSATVNGTLRFDGQEIAVSGFGFQDHSLMNIAVTAFSNRWVHFRCFSDQHTIIITEILTDQDYEPSRITLALVAEGDRIIYQGKQATIKLSDPVMDHEYRYAYPRYIGYQVSDETFSLIGSVEVKRLLERMAVLSHLNPVLRGVVHTFIAKPVYYRCLNEYVMIYEYGEDSTRLEGEALTEVVFVK
jgi:hypothetical protein